MVIDETYVVPQEIRMQFVGAKTRAPKHMDVVYVYA